MYPVQADQATDFDPAIELDPSDDDYVAERAKTLQLRLATTRVQLCMPGWVRLLPPHWAGQHATFPVSSGRT